MTRVATCTCALTLLISVLSRSWTPEALRRHTFASFHPYTVWARHDWGCPATLISVFVLWWCFWLLVYQWCCYGVKISGVVMAWWCLCGVVAVASLCCGVLVVWWWLCDVAELVVVWWCLLRCGGVLAVWSCWCVGCVFVVCGVVLSRGVVYGVAVSLWCRDVGVVWGGLCGVVMLACLWCFFWLVGCFLVWCLLG